MPEVGSQTLVTMKAMWNMPPTLEQILMNSIDNYQSMAIAFLDTVAEPYYFIEDTEYFPRYYLYAANSMAPREWQWHYLVQERDGKYSGVQPNHVPSHIRRKLATNPSWNIINVQ